MKETSSRIPELGARAYDGVMCQIGLLLTRVEEWLTYRVRLILAGPPKGAITRQGEHLLIHCSGTIISYIRLNLCTEVLNPQLPCHILISNAKRIRPDALDVNKPK